MHRHAAEGGVLYASRAARALWLTVAIAFLALLAVLIWGFVRTGAASGLLAGWHHHELIETETDTNVDLPAAEPVAGVAAPAETRAYWAAPFRPEPMPLPETEEGTIEEEGTNTVDPPPSKGNVIYSGRKNDRMEIALSFDDGPHPYYTPLILDILAEYDIRATFFMVGENVTYYTAAAEAVVAAGHEIGNHTFSHRQFNRMNEHEMLDEIAGCEDAISSITEARPHFIRPPEGQMNETMRRVIGSLDYRIVLWDVDTRDWAHTPPTTICNHILDTVQAGDIILMHDFIGHNSPTPEALRLVIPALLERGYHFVTVGELVDGA